MKQLSLIEKAFFLKKTSLFRELDLDLLLAIAEKMPQDIYDANESVFEINQRATRMYFIVSGGVQIFDAREKPIFKLASEDFFGEESLLSELPRKYLAICTTKTLFLTLPPTSLLTILTECPSVALSLLQNYAKNIHNRFLKPSE
ncbi:MAG: cyclic nucleotide-binding domain-containing protein [Chlamydiota bacterium]